MNRSGNVFGIEADFDIVVRREIAAKPIKPCLNAKMFERRRVEPIRQGLDITRQFGAILLNFQQPLVARIPTCLPDFERQDGEPLTNIVMQFAGYPSPMPVVLAKGSSHRRMSND